MPRSSAVHHLLLQCHLSRSTLWAVLPLLSKTIRHCTYHIYGCRAKLLMPYCHKDYLAAVMNQLGWYRSGVRLHWKAKSKGFTGFHPLVPIQGSRLRCKEPPVHCHSMIGTGRRCRYADRRSWQAELSRHGWQAKGQGKRNSVITNNRQKVGAGSRWRKW